MNKKFNIKHLVTISAVALAMISASGIAINTNTNVHADVVSSDIAIANKVNKGQSAQIKRNETHAEIAGDRSDPNALAEDVDYNYSFVKHHKSQLFKGLPKSVINYAKLNRESMLKKGTSTSFTYDDYVKSLKSHKNKRLHKIYKHVSHKHKATKRTKSHKKRITKHHKAYKRINRKRSRKNHKYIKRSHRIARHNKRNRK